MSVGGGELVTTNKPAVDSEPFLDATVVKDGKSDRCFPDPSWSDESDRSKVFCETDDLVDQLVPPKKRPRRRGRRLSRCDRLRYRMLDLLVVWSVD